MLPFHLDTSKTNAACTHDITHDWVPQHQSWDNGAIDGFVTSRLPINTNGAVLTIGYHTRAGLPFYYAVADAFTVCDNYFFSVIGPTDPNRLYTMAASIDPAGQNGGSLLQTLVANRSSFFGKLTYTTMPEQLQARGISWKVYSLPDQNILNIARTSPLYLKAFGPQFPVDFLADALSGNLPQVSWVLASIVDPDHPPAPSLFGENTLSAIISALTGNPALWAKTVLFATYDENGGFLDHVAPVTAPPGTPAEYITAPAVPDPTGGRNSSDSRPYRIGFSCADACDLSVQPRWICIVGSLRSHLSAAIPRDTFWRGSAQPERMAACHRWRSHEHI